MWQECVRHVRHVRHVRILWSHQESALGKQCYNYRQLRKNPGEIQETRRDKTPNTLTDFNNRYAVDWRRASMKVDHGPRSSLVENHTVHSCTILYVHVESELKSLRMQMKSFAALDPPIQQVCAGASDVSDMSLTTSREVGIKAWTVWSCGTALQGQSCEGYFQCASPQMKCEEMWKYVKWRWSSEKIWSEMDIIMDINLLIFWVFPAEYVHRTS